MANILERSMDGRQTGRVPESERLHIKEQELLRTIRDSKLWGAMIADILKGHGTSRRRIKKTSIFYKQIPPPQVFKTA